MAFSGFFSCFVGRKLVKSALSENLTGEFMRIIYAASRNLFTLTAGADRVLCQLVMFLTVFSTGYTKWNTAAMKSLLLFMAGLFIGFLVEKCVASRWHRFPVFLLAWCVRGFKSLKRFWPYLIAFRSWPSMVSLCNYCICVFMYLI